MPFPFSLIDSFDIETPGDPASDPVPDLTAAISDWLAKQRAKAVWQTARGISFKAGLFRTVTGWNILCPVGSGEIEISRHETVIRVTYRLRFSELLIVATAGVAVVVGFPVLTSAIGAAGAFAIFVVGWLWLFGMNYLLAKKRIPRALRGLRGKQPAGRSRSHLDRDRDGSGTGRVRRRLPRPARFSSPISPCSRHRPGLRSRASPAGRGPRRFRPPVR